MDTRDFARVTLISGLWAGLLSALTVTWGARAHGARGPAGINATSHWLWGDESLHTDDLDWRHTGVGLATHQASAWFWASLYAAIRLARKRRTPVDAVTDAITVTGVAIVVDLGLVPKRLTPGFEHRMTSRRLGVVYLSLLAGLAIGAMLSERR